jgi:hypothetical protein
MSVMVLDSGNSIIKAKIARHERGEVSFPHALRKLTETEYSGLMSRKGLSDPPADYIRVNDQPYVVVKARRGMGSSLREMEQPDIRGIIMDYSQLPH